MLKKLGLLCSAAGLERDKFDNKTVSFEEHIKLEHNIWNYLYFIVLVREKNKTDYTGPESYVAHMIKVGNVKERKVAAISGSQINCFFFCCFRTTTWTGFHGCRPCHWW